MTADVRVATFYELTGILNPLSNWNVDRDGKKVLLSDIYPTYDWVNDDGYTNLGTWIEAAAKKAGK
jgi:hypothetical protein